MRIFRKEVHGGISAQTHTAESDIPASGNVWGSTLTLHKASSFAVQCVSSSRARRARTDVHRHPEGLRGVQSAMRSRNKELTSFGAIRRVPNVLFLMWERSGPVNGQQTTVSQESKLGLAWPGSELYSDYCIVSILASLLHLHLLRQV